LRYFTFAERGSLPDYPSKNRLNNRGTLADCSAPRTSVFLESLRRTPPPVLLDVIWLNMICRTSDLRFVAV
jgi:hypothetical protein